MPQLKWENNYAIIRVAPTEPAVEKGLPFDLSVLQPKGWTAKIPSRIGQNLLRFWLWIGRDTGWFVPLPIYWQAPCISRATDVRDVLSRNRTFNVPYGLEMELLIAGPDCLLGDDSELHTKQRVLLLQAILPADAERVRTLSRHFAGVLIENSDGTINVIADLITRAVTEVCASYFGFEVDEPDAFAQWTIAMSAWLFADPLGDAAIRRLALDAAARVRIVIDRAIARSKDNPARGEETLIDRLINLRAAPKGPAIEDAEIRAMLLAMIVGQVPTMSLAAGNILEELRRRPNRWAEATAAARNGDMDVLATILFECARLNPALQPGQWRYVAQDAVIGEGWRRKKVKQGSMIMVCVMSALVDGRVFKSPGEFRMDRAARHEPTDLMYGFDWHRCLGKYFAVAEITEIFAALLVQQDLQPAKGKAGAMVKAGPYPRAFTMTFTPNSSRGA